MMMEENKSTAGGLFCANKPVNHISYHQQTGSLFCTCLQAAATKPTSDLSFQDQPGEECVGGLSYGTTKPSAYTFAAAKPDTTLGLFTQPKPKLFEDHLRGF